MYRRPQLAKDIEARLGREVFVSPAVAEVTVEGSGFPSTLLWHFAKK